MQPVFLINHVQDEFLDAIERSGEYYARVLAYANFFRADGAQVVWAMYTDPSDMEKPFDWDEELSPFFVEGQDMMLQHNMDSDVISFQYPKNPSLYPWLHHQWPPFVVIAGIYTEACIRDTAIHLSKMGIKTFVVEQLCSSSKDALHPERAKQEMRDAGVEFLSPQQARQMVADYKPGMKIGADQPGPHL